MWKFECLGGVATIVINFAKSIKSFEIAGKMPNGSIKHHMLVPIQLKQFWSALPSSLDMDKKTFKMYWIFMLN